jgi:hypothetical protein
MRLTPVLRRLPLIGTLLIGLALLWCTRPYGRGQCPRCGYLGDLSDCKHCGYRCCTGCYQKEQREAGYYRCPDCHQANP